MLYVAVRENKKERVYSKKENSLKEREREREREKERERERGGEGLERGTDQVAKKRKS